LDFNQDIIKNNSFFFTFFFLFLLLGLGSTEYFGRDNLHLIINKYHSPFFDLFFKYLSKIGPIIFIASILFYVIKNTKYKVLFLLLSAYLFNFVITTFIKRTFFIHVHRPTYYFSQKGVDLHLIDGVSSQIPYTFPSGHTSESFLLMLFICMLSSSKWLQIISGCIAISMAFSRVYLSKHFFIDTIGGALIGVFSITFMYYFYQNKNSAFLDRKII
jgi:membrane-associated phospholipid phosphatase